MPRCGWAALSTTRASGDSEKRMSTDAYGVVFLGRLAYTKEEAMVLPVCSRPLGIANT